MAVDEITVNEEAETPPKLTVVVPVKFTPEIITEPELAAEVGVKDVITGSAT